MTRTILSALNCGSIIKHLFQQPCTAFLPTSSSYAKRLVLNSNRYWSPCFLSCAWGCGIRSPSLCPAKQRSLALLSAAGSVVALKSLSCVRNGPVSNSLCVCPKPAWVKRFKPIMRFMKRPLEGACLGKRGRFVSHPRGGECSPHALHPSHCPRLAPWTIKRHHFELSKC